MYHGLCVVARERGYALAIHGTVTSDLDLIAIPWTEEAVSGEELRDALMAHIDACDFEGSLVRFGLSKEMASQIAAQHGQEKALKPHGRVAWNLYLEHGCKVDLSVMPRLPLNHSAGVA
jgi:hypothetical protein